MDAIADPPALVPLGPDHLGALLAILGFSTLLPIAATRLRSPRAPALAGAFLAIVILVAKVAEPFWYSARGIPWTHLLPLHLCDLAAFAAAAMLLTGRPFLYELAYYWGLGGTVQALLTPDLAAAFPSADFLFFFGAHGLVIAAVFHATGAYGLRPRGRALPKVALVTLLSLLPAGAANLLFGTNYMYLRAKPEAATLLDLLGPWPWYLLGLLPLGTAFLLLWYSPFWIGDRWPSPPARKAG